MKVLAPDDLQAGMIVTVHTRTDSITQTVTSSFGYSQVGDRL